MVYERTLSKWFGVMAAQHAFSKTELRPQRGFTLVEVLISVVVLAVGVLGLANLQIKGMKQGKGSLQAAQATALAYSLADLLRANKSGYAGYLQDPNGFNTMSAPAKDCRNNQCTSAELASYDTYYWFNDYSFVDSSGAQINVPGLKTILGAGASAWVTCQVVASGTCSTNSVYKIGVFWDRNRGGTQPATQYDCYNGTAYNASASTELACVIISVQI